MLDVKAAYRPKTPSSPEGLDEALVQVGGEVIPMYIYTRWYDGRRQRFNLVQFGPGNSLKRDLRGWNGDLVML